MKSLSNRSGAFILSISIACLSAILTPATLQAQFTVTIGDEYGDEGLVVLPDGAGGAFVAGTFVGEVDFEPGGGMTLLNDPDLFGDVFLARYDDNGDLLFVLGIGNGKSSGVQGIASDGSGGVFIAGAFKDTVDVDPGAGVTNLVAAGASFDIFLVRYDGSGNLISAVSLGNAADSEGINSLMADGSGGVYMTGYFYHTVDFDPGGGTANLTAAGALGSSDAFVAHYDASGNYQSAFQLGSDGADQGAGLAPDGKGGMYVGGLFAGTVDFDTGGGTSNRTSAGARDAFVARYDMNGDFVSVLSFGGVNGENVNDISADDSSGVFVTGSFFGGADFDPTAGTLNRTSEGNDDMFVARYDSTGNVVFAHAFGTSGFSERGNCVRSDGGGGVYVAGTFQNTIDFDPGDSTAVVISNGSNDAVLAHYNGDGEYIAAIGIGGPSADEAWCMGYEGPEALYLTGGFQGTADFDPGPGSDERASNGTLDVFLMKLSNVPTPEATSMMSVSTDGTVDFGSDVGVCIDFDGIFGPGDVTVERYEAPVQNPQGVGNPVVYETHWRIIASFGLIFGPNTVLRIKLDDLPPGKLPDPENIQFYKRSLYGAGLLEPVTTVYDSGSNELRMSGFTSFSEFVGGGEAEVVLPVELASFESVLDGSTIRLSWTTASETANAGFEVQHTSDLDEWATIGFVAGRGTTTEPVAYEYVIDGLIPGRHRFRLKQLDYDGSFAFSQIVEALVEVVETHFLSAAYPNPFNPSSRFSLVVSRAQNVKVELFDATGRFVTSIFQGRLDANAATLFEISGSSLPSGIYFYRVTGEYFSDSRPILLLR